MKKTLCLLLLLVVLAAEVASAKETYHPFKLGKMTVSGVAITFEFPMETGSLYLFNMKGPDGLKSESRLVIRLFDAAKKPVAENNSVWVEPGMHFGSVPFSGVTPEKAKQIRYFTLDIESK